MDLYSLLFFCSSSLKSSQRLQSTFDPKQQKGGGGGGGGGWKNDVRAKKNAMKRPQLSSVKSDFFHNKVFQLARPAAFKFTVIYVCTKSHYYLENVCYILVSQQPDLRAEKLRDLQSRDVISVCKNDKNSRVLSGMNIMHLFWASIGAWCFIVIGIRIHH